MDNCTVLDANELNGIAQLRGGFSVFVGIVSLLLVMGTLPTICFSRNREICKKNKLYSLHAYCCNPFLWFALASTVTSFSFALNFGNIYDETYCTFSGYIIQTFESFDNWMTLFFALYLVFYACCNGKPLTDDPADMSSRLCYLAHCCTVLVCVALFLLVTFVYNMPPVIANAGGSYGNSGPWCWIEGKGAQVGFWYGLYWAFAISATGFFILATVLFLCGYDNFFLRNGCTNFFHRIGCDKVNNFLGRIRWSLTSVIFASILLRVYIVHIGLSILESVIRLADIRDCSVIVDMWRAYAVLTPLSKLPLVLIATLFVTARLTSKPDVESATEELTHLASDEY